MSSDDTGIASVDVSIRDTSPGEWWHQDGTWGDERSYPASLDTPQTTSTGWSFPWTLPSQGAFEAQATARDLAGNVDGSSASVTFQVAAGTSSSEPSPSVAPDAPLDPTIT